MASHPVAVEVDPLLGLTVCDIAEVSGIELGSAPRRLPNFHTMETRVTFVPYGSMVHPVSPALALRLVVALSLLPSGLSDRDRWGLKNRSKLAFTSSALSVWVL